MTQPEFNSWWRDLTTRFPSMASWFTRLQPVAGGSQVEHQRRLLQTWFDVLKDVPLADAMEVNAQMQRGDLEAIGGFDSEKEQTPNVVRRRARQLAYDREQRLRRPAEQYGERKYDNFPAGKILRRIIALQDKGVSPEEAKAIVYREFECGDIPVREVAQ